MATTCKRNLTIKILSAATLTILLATGGTVAQDTIRIGGTGTALVSAKLMADEFEKSHPDIKIVIFPSLGSSGGIKAVSKGALNLSFSARALDSSELTLGLRQKLYAKTPFVFVVKRSERISELTTSALNKIYSGVTTSWPNGERIRFVMRPSSETDTKLAKAISPEVSQAIDSIMANPGIFMALTDQECIDLLDRTPGALGFTTLTMLTTTDDSLTVVKLNGVVPSVRALSDGTYPMAKPLYLITGSSISPAAKMFADFIQSAEGRNILERSGNQALADGAVE